MRSWGIYKFFERYQSLSLHDKLIAYPIFSTSDMTMRGLPYSTEFFEEDFPIVAEHYYASVAAIFDVYGDFPPQLLETRRAFFQFLHVAYSLALGRRPASSHPLMVYAQHWRNNVLARCFVEDFPQARFLHTVRDPIAAFDRSFEWWSKESNDACAWVIQNLTKDDQPHLGMESRTRAIRFEDLHNNTAETISQLVDWLGLPHHVALLSSTFNGIPYVVERAGINWSGPRPEQAVRSSRYIASTDQALLFALFYENFFAWNYSCPRIFGHAFIRGLTCMLVLPIPMKAEIICAFAVIKVEVLPSLRRGSFRSAFGSLVRIFRGRLIIARRIAGEFLRRLIFGKVVLKIL